MTPNPAVRGGWSPGRAIASAGGRPWLPAWLVLMSMAGLVAAPPLEQPRPSPEAGIATFLNAETARDAARAADRLIAAGDDVQHLLDRLRAGRRYAADVPRGELTWRVVGPGGIPLVTTVFVPLDYSPDVRYPVRVYLHGGVMRQTAEYAADGRRPRRRLDCTAPCIGVYPTGSSDAPWWSAAQVDGIARTLDRLKRTYNVDEGRVHVMGVSDGGTGAWYLGLRDATPWSAIFPFNGHLGVLANPGTGVDGDLFASNLTNVPLYVINGGADPLYPVVAVEPYVVMLQKAGAPLLFRPQMTAGHDTSWWPSERTLVDAFDRRHPRDPLPDRLSWRTSRTDRDNRFRWLVIDALDASRTETALPDPNALERPAPYDFGLRVDSRKEQGRRLVAVVPDTDAARMGLRKDDLLLTIDGMPIESVDDIGRAFDAHRVPAPMVVVVERKGQRVESRVDFPPAPMAPVQEQAFARRRRSGRVDLQRAGNSVEARTQGVSAFTLLLSPAEFDFEEPVVVVVNGRRVHDARVRMDAATLLHWAARDADRTMLFAAELTITVPPR